MNIGHNSGPSMEPGRAWRKHVWTKARADLLPRLPIEVLRLRLRRAKELGLDYTTYASIRASTGRDVIGFLFSSNALRLLRDGDVLAEGRAAKLLQVTECDQTALAIVPLRSASVLRAAPMLSAVLPAPKALDSWTNTAAHLQDVLRQRQVVPDGVVIIGETASERDWTAAAKAAGFISGEAFFGAA